MKIFQQKTGSSVMKQVKGFTLLDVLLAIVIFVVGMLALASLQTNLTRSSIDATTRTAATNIGEEILERLRSFQRVSTDPDGLVFAFADIDEDFVETLLTGGVGNTVPRAGLVYTVDAQVSGYEFNDDKTAVTETSPAVAGILYDFKRIELNISWDNNQQFQVSDTVQVSSADMNTGLISIAGLIPSVPSLATAVVAATDDGELGGVQVDYTPGLRPNVIAINLENGKFKESTQPELLPKNETWFEVVTFNTNPENVFLRREEFLFVGCTCDDLSLPSADEGTGFLPAIWTGKAYAIGNDEEFVAKPFAQSSDNNQSVFCSTCCRDHHDSSAAEFSGADYRFDPQGLASEVHVDGDHKHYRRGNNGSWDVVGYGQKGPQNEYLESCRMVRKDGFMRVAQDVKQDSLVAFPAAYLFNADDAKYYSQYLTDALTDYYENDRDALTGPDGEASPPVDWLNAPYVFAGSENSPTTLPFLGLPSQQLISRGIYVDHLGAEVLDLIECIEPKQMAYDPDAEGPTPGDECGVPGVQNYLEVFPFFEVQTTVMGNWSEDPPGNPVLVGSPDRPKTDPGFALLVDEAAPGQSVMAEAKFNRANSGLAVYSPVREIDSELYDDAAQNVAPVFIDVNDGLPADADPPTPSLYSWVAGLEFLKGMSTYFEVAATDCATPATCNTYCERTAETLGCARPVTAGAGEVKISGYDKSNASGLWICASGPAGFTIENFDPESLSRYAVINWPNTSDLSGITLMVQDSACSP